MTGQVRRVISQLAPSAWRSSDPVSIDCYARQNGERFATRDPSTGTPVVLTWKVEKGETPSWETFEAKVNGFELSPESAKSSFNLLKEHLRTQRDAHIADAQKPLHELIIAGPQALLYPWHYHMGLKSEQFTLDHGQHFVVLESEMQRLKFGNERRTHRKMYYHVRVPTPLGGNVAEILADFTERARLFDALASAKLGKVIATVRRMRASSRSSNSHSLKSFITRFSISW
jgi:hypothetical protein